MTLERQRELLTAARGHLARGWLAHMLWLPSDGQFGTGPVCAIGALYRAIGVDLNASFTIDVVTVLSERLGRETTVLYPQYIRHGYGYVLVNNDHGQAAILEVFDRAIARLEAELNPKLDLQAAAAAVDEPELVAV